MTTTATVQPDQLPATIRAYLAAHRAGESSAAARTFSADVVIIDDGRTYRGTAEARDFLEKASTEYSYTTELIGAERLDPHRWVAINRLTGNFPGGRVVLDHRFTLRDDLIAELVISPRAQSSET